MRYESIPRKIKRWLVSTFKFIHNEFGKWAYIIIAFLIFLIYKPILRLLDLTSQFVLYGFLGILALFIGYRIFKKFI